MRISYPSGGGDLLAAANHALRVTVKPAAERAARRFVGASLH